MSAGFQIRKPGLRVGEAAERGIWSLEHEAFHPVRRILKDLFSRLTSG